MSNIRNHFIVGTIVHSMSLDDLHIIKKGYIAVKEGKIIGIGDVSTIDDISKYIVTHELNCEVTELSDSQFLMPGFIDCHIHAPQMPNIGLGLGMPLLDWLETFTFPLEAEYKNIDFASKVYDTVVKRTLTCGTTTASYFATIHKDSTLALARACNDQGQRALIGKVNMNALIPSYYREETFDSIRETKDIVQAILSMNSPIIRPIITPRFVLSCDMHLMTELANIAKEHNLNIQSHISENRSEIKAVAKAYPNSANYASVYDEAKLLTNKTIMAHGVYLTDDELVILKNRGTSIAHCPVSNTNLASGLCNVRRLLKAGLTVGLGTDISGGSACMILDVMRRTLDMSQHLSFLKSNEVVCPSGMLIDEQTPLTHANVMYLATLGGAEALSLDSQIGNFIVGKDFDVLLIDVLAPGSPIDKFDYTATLTEKLEPNDAVRISNYLQKFILVGDERNIIKVFVDGKQVK